MTFILLDTAKTDKENNTSYFFANPVKIISCYRPKSISSSFKQIEKALAQGYYVGGFVSYEAGYYLQRPPVQNKRSDFPLIWMGVFNKPRLVGKLTLPRTLPDNYKLNNIHLNISPKKYYSVVKKIKEYIAQGQTYQVNYTLKYKFNFVGDPLSFYLRLRNSQPVSYSAFIQSKDFHILSFSPELFFRKEGDEITVRPMKGTVIRGISLSEDQKNKTWLKNDEKNRAENIMITDMLRNDLGKISRYGSVRTAPLCNVEKYQTLWQMTSTVKSRSHKDIPLQQLFSGLFPSGSVTGAPKIRTTQIIEKLEKEERKIYTGAIGFITPEKNAVFNVAIRTILLQKHKGELGIGSGITYHSDPQTEFAECKLKADFLWRRPFQLIETIGWQKRKGFSLLALHLKRLRNSAQYFDYLYNEKYIREQLLNNTQTLLNNQFYKIRLLLFADGRITIASYPVSPSITSTKITISKLKTDFHNIFLYHKTTNRKIYEQEYEKHHKAGYFDVIFRNERGEITEGAISNIFVKKNGYYYTPPVKCGLLPGIFREYFLTKNKFRAREKILRMEDITQADEIILTNAVRGMTVVKF